MTLTSNLMEESHRLVHLEEWSVYPLIKLNLQCNIVYLNLSARANFPDLYTLGIKHPIFDDLLEKLDSLSEYKNELIIFSREITLYTTTYEQQIFILPHDNSILICLINITAKKEMEKIDLKMMENNRLLESYKNKLNTMYSVFKKNKDRIDYAMLAARAGTWMWDIRKNILTWDTNINNILNNSSQIGQLQTILKMMVKQDLKKLIADFKLALKDDGFFDSHFSIQNQNNETKHLSIRGQIYFDANHKPFRMAGICTDISTKIKKAVSRGKPLTNCL